MSAGLLGLGRPVQVPVAVTVSVPVPVPFIVFEVVVAVVVATARVIGVVIVGTFSERARLRVIMRLNFATSGIAGAPAPPRGTSKTLVPLSC